MGGNHHAQKEEEQGSTTLWECGTTPTKEGEKQHHPTEGDGQTQHHMKKQMGYPCPSSLSGTTTQKEEEWWAPHRRTGTMVPTASSETQLVPRRKPSTSRNYQLFIAKTACFWKRLSVPKKTLKLGPEAFSRMVFITKQHLEQFNLILFNWMWFSFVFLWSNSILIQCT